MVNGSVKPIIGVIFRNKTPLNSCGFLTTATAPIQQTVVSSALKQVTAGMNPPHGEKKEP
jgi:hypothetical protein